MAGISVGGGSGKRRSLDSEINMIPMIDLLMVTISFLLITAVWVHAHRLEADASVPSPSSAAEPCEHCADDPKLQIDARDRSKYVLSWVQGPTTLRRVDVPRDRRDLAAKIGEEWRAAGRHRDAHDRFRDRAVVRTADDTRYEELIAVMDAASAPKRPVALAGGKIGETNAFEVTFSTK